MDKGKCDKLVEELIDIYESRRDESRGGPESAMRVVLFKVKQAIRDEVLEEAAKVCERRDIISALSASAHLRAMKGKTNDF